MVTIKQASELTGVSAHTIRAWERRYGVVAPSRTEAGYRLYAEADLDRLRTMKDLVGRGWTASAAAQSSARPAAARTAAIDQFVTAAARLDGEAIHTVLADQFADGDFEELVDGFLMPALSELGRAWSDGRVSVAGEHLASNLIRGRLSAIYQDTPAGGGPTLVIGAPPGSEHELGLLAFAVAARRAGATTVYLGADVPASDWRLAASSGTSAVVTAVYVRRDLDHVGRVAEQLAGMDVALCVGGSQQDKLPAPWRPLGHLIAPAASLLATG